MPTYTEADHKTHNSLVAPVVGCEFCAKEVYRREHKCFGDGASTMPAPTKATSGV